MGSDTELAWAAGFFDGEGHTFYRRGLGVQVGQYEETTLTRFLTAVGAGRVYGPYVRKDGKLNWMWGAWGANGAKALVAMWPYLSQPKRDQATKALEQRGKARGQGWRRDLYEVEAKPSK